MTALGVGVLGVGDIARNLYVPGIIESGRTGRELRLVGVSTRSPDGRAWMADRYPDIRVYDDYAAMLADPEIEMVVNLTPPTEHARTTLAAIRAGKHVFSEKPIATTIGDADEVIAAAAAAGVTVACAPVIGVHPEVRQAIEWIHRGAVGSVSMVRARASHPGPAWFPDFTTDPTWFYQPGSGPVLDVAVYPLHVLCLMLGPVQRVTALAATSHPRREIRSGPAKGEVVDVTTPDNVHMVLDFGDARLASIDATWNALSARGPRMEVYGDRGVLNMYSRPEDPPYELFIDDQSTGVRGWLQTEPPYRGSLMPVLGREPVRWSFIDGLEDVARSIAAGATPVPSAELARHILDICLSALRSAESGRVVELSTTFSRQGGA